MVRRFLFPKPPLTTSLKSLALGPSSTNWTSYLSKMETDGFALGEPKLPTPKPFRSPCIIGLQLITFLVSGEGGAARNINEALTGVLYKFLLSNMFNFDPNFLS